MGCITERGFERPTYEEILRGQIARAKQLFGEDMDVSEESILGKFIRINALDIHACYETLEDIYYARFPNTARGFSLDRLAPFAAVARNQATPAQIELKLTGSPDALIPMATIFRIDEKEFYSVNDERIGSGGTVILKANCTEDGKIVSPPKGANVAPKNPSIQISKVEFIQVLDYGKEIESDTAFRERFSKGLMGAGSSTENAIKGAIFRVPLVEGVEIESNETDRQSGNLPPHSFCCYVLAPESQYGHVAKAIFAKKPLGIQCIGDIEQEVVDSWGKVHKIRFSTTKKVELTISIKIKVNRYFQADGADRIKNAIAGYVNSLSNGENVYRSSIYGYVHSAEGVLTVTDLSIRRMDALKENGDVPIKSQEVARIQTKDITVEVAE